MTHDSPRSDDSGGHRASEEPPGGGGGGGGGGNDEYVNIGDHRNSRGGRQVGESKSRRRYQPEQPKMDPELQSFADALKKKAGAGGKKRFGLGGGGGATRKKPKQKHIIMSNVQLLPGTLRSHANDDADSVSAGQSESFGDMAHAASALEGPAVGNNFVLGIRPRKSGSRSPARSPAR
mgnify:CR=1 FL=1